jgi:hypothetical protein
MTQFVKVGRITRDRHALRVEIDGRNGPGDLVIGAAAVRELFDGKEVDVSFVQVRSTDQVFIGWSGTARVSRSGRAITLRIEGQTYTSPIAQVRAVIAGTRAAAILSRPEPAPILDADREQAKPIDADLVRSFV